MIFRTQNSTYELDTETKRIRRLEGKIPATDRQGSDGEWREYTEISDIKIGQGVIVVWRYEGLITKTTVLSVIIEIPVLN